MIWQAGQIGPHISDNGGFGSFVFFGLFTDLCLRIEFEEHKVDFFSISIEVMGPFFYELFDECFILEELSGKPSSVLDVHG